MDTAHHTLHLPPHHTTLSESLTESAISVSTLLLCVGVTALALLLNLIQLLMLRRVTTLLYSIHHQPVRREEGVQVLPRAPPPPYSNSTRREFTVRAGSRGLPRPVPRSPTPHQEHHRRNHTSQTRFHPLDIRSTPALHTEIHRV